MLQGCKWKSYGGLTMLTNAGSPIMLLVVEQPLTAPTHPPNIRLWSMEHPPDSVSELLLIANPPVGEWKILLRTVMLPFLSHNMIIPPLFLIFKANVLFAIRPLKPLAVWTPHPVIGA